eukprot:8180337-Pyramimonas_sp.AAC.1
MRSQEGVRFARKYRAGPLFLWASTPWPEYGGSIRREPGLWMTCEKVSGGNRLPMGPVDRVTNPTGTLDS